MCLKCTYSHLEQLRWELIVQESELSGTKVSEEVLETVKSRLQENSDGKPMLPRIKLQRPGEMNDQQYGEATHLFKEGMLQKRRVQIAAIDILTELLEQEAFQPYPVLSVSAGVILNGDDDEGEGSEHEQHH